MVSATLLQIKYTPQFYNDDGLVTAWCEELGVAAPGKSNEEAAAALAATVRMYCDMLERRGTLAKTLAEAGLAATEIPVDKTSDDEVVLVVGTGRTGA